MIFQALYEQSSQINFDENPVNMWILSVLEMSEVEYANTLEMEKQDLNLELGRTVHLQCSFKNIYILVFSHSAQIMWL